MDRNRLLKIAKKTPTETPTGPSTGDTDRANEPRPLSNRKTGGHRDLGERAAARREERERTQKIFDDHRKAQERTIEVKRDILGRLSAGDQSLFDIMIEALEGLAIATDDGRFYLESYRLLMGSEAPDEVKARFGLLDDPKPIEPLQVEEPAPVEESEAAPMIEAPFAFDVLHFPDHLFYDIETFRYYWLVVFKDIEHNIVAEYKIEGNEITQIKGRMVQDGKSGKPKEKKQSIKTLVKDKWLVGFNNYEYDDYILALAIATTDNTLLKSLNDWIIAGNRKADGTIDKNPFHWRYAGDMGEVNSLETIGISRWNDKTHRYETKWPFKKSLDCMQQLPKSASLKKLEAQFGLDIEETAVPFDLDRELTKEEQDKTVFYCEADVDATIDIFKLRYHDYFEPKSALVAQLPKGSKPDDYRLNTTTLSAKIVSGEPNPTKRREWPDINLGDRQDWILAQVPEQVREAWLSWNPLRGETCPTIPTFEAFGCKVSFGNGGVHGANTGGRSFSNIVDLDVVSMYPSIMLDINALGEWTSNFEKIVNWRKRVKHTDPALQKALKLVINSVYGLLLSQYSPLYNPNVQKSVVIYGQASLYNLAERLYQAGYTIVQVNTDGVFFTGSGSCDYRTIWKDWERDWKINLEEDCFASMYQKDVSNYIAAYNEDRTDLKVKGGGAVNYNNSVDLDAGIVTGNIMNSNSAGIIDRCVVAYILDGIEPIETIKKNLDDPILYQFVLHCASNFRTFDDFGNDYQRTNRVFAVREDGVELFKVGGKLNNATKFSDVPKCQWVVNEALDTIDLNEFSSRLDLEYYENLAWRKLKDWGFSREQ